MKLINQTPTLGRHTIYTYRLLRRLRHPLRRRRPLLFGFLQRLRRLRYRHLAEPFAQPLPPLAHQHHTPPEILDVTNP